MLFKVVAFIYNADSTFSPRTELKKDSNIQKKIRHAYLNSRLTHE
jgi:hypothetical protein